MTQIKYITLAFFTIVITGCSVGGKATSVSGSATGGSGGNVTVTTETQADVTATGQGSASTTKAPSTQGSDSEANPAVNTDAAR